MTEFWFTLKRLLLGVSLILAAGAVLLFSDLRSRKEARAARERAGAPAAAGKTYRIALVQHASQTVLEDGVNGMIKGLEENGFVVGRNLEIKRFNPQGDLPTANAIAKDIVNERYDLVLTVSTLSMQTVANANRAGQVKHVFGLVSDPYGAGVGINRTNHSDHPAHMTGYATLQPVDRCFQLARDMRPDLKRVGVVWNPAESNSEVQLRLARAACQKLGIELLEATADNSSGVGEAAGALVARGIEAIWLPGDVTVLTAAEALIQTARKARIPTFSVIPPHAEKGALFDLGADYTEVGRLTGVLAGEVLAGKDPASIPVEPLTPEILVINKTAVNGLKDTWRISESLVQAAFEVIDEKGPHKKSKPVVTSKTQGLTKQWRIQLVNYNESAAAEEVIHGVDDGFKAAGLTEGKDFTMKKRSAQGDVATLNSIFDAAGSEGVDLFFLLSTPTLQTAVKKVPQSIPVVFTFVANPLIAGAGESSTNHKPNIAGVSSLGPYREMALLLKQHFPQYKKVGTLFCPAEINSVHNKDVFVKEATAVGLTVEIMPANTGSDLPDAAVALCSLQLDAVVQIVDNLTAAGFASISKAAIRAHLPLISFNGSTAQQGAAVVLSRDFHQSGIEGAEVAVRVMRGENPANIPFSFVKKTRTIVNTANAKALGMTIPEALIKSADEVIR